MRGNSRAAVCAAGALCGRVPQGANIPWGILMDNWYDKEGQKPPESPGKSWKNARWD
jgi:hypothetical protein